MKKEEARAPSGASPARRVPECPYFSNLTRAEVIVFKAFDSDAPNALNAAHAAFDDPTAAADAAPRASVEARFVAFFD